MSTVVNLSKDTTVKLEKPDGSKPVKFSVGLAWDPVKSKGFLGWGGSKKAIDLDASVVVLDESGRTIDLVWYQKKISSCGSIRHSGDNLTGEGDGDDETIRIDASGLPKEARYLVFTVSSFRGQTFSQVENASCSVYDDREHKLVHMNLSEKGNHTGLVMAVIELGEAGWKVRGVGRPCTAQVAPEMMRDIVASL